MIRYFRDMIVVAVAFFGAISVSSASPISQSSLELDSSPIANLKEAGGSGGGGGTIDTDSN